MDKRETDSVRRSMLVKWLSIPYSIFVLFCAGASYNLHDRWNFIFEENGFEKPAHNYTLLVVLFGYYLGAVSGLIIHRLDNRYAYGIASVLAFIGYIGLAIISKVIEAKMLHFVIVLALMFIAAFSGSVAIMAAVNTPIEGFSRLAGFLTIILLIGYLKISPIFEDAIHSGWMKEIVKTSTENSYRAKVANAIYYAALGIFISLVYFVGGFVQRKIFLEEKYEERIRPSERAGLYIFILIEIVLVFILYFVGVVYDNYKKSVVIIGVFILGNFGFYLVAYAITSSKLDDTQYLLSDTRPEKGRDMSYLAVIGDPKFIGLFLPSLIIVGTTYAVYYNIIEKSTTISKKMLIIDSYFDTFWLGDVLARIIGGLIAYLLGKSLHEFFFGIVAALITAVGFAFFIAFEANHQVNLMYAGMIGIGIGSGMWWVLAPMIIHDDAGSKSFSLLWGSILTMNFSGILFFTMVFILIWTNVANAASMIYIISFSSGIFAAIICTYSFAQERKEKWLNIKQE